MAHSTKKRHPEHGNAWRDKETDEQYDMIKTKDGKEYTLHLPNFNQYTTNRGRSKKYEDVFGQIKIKVKDDLTIEKNDDGLPILHPVAWAALLSHAVLGSNPSTPVKVSYHCETASRFWLTCCHGLGVHQQLVEHLC